VDVWDGTTFTIPVPANYYTVKGAWSEIISYLPGDLVEYLGDYYGCILWVGPTSTTPNNDGSHWQKNNPVYENIYGTTYFSDYEYCVVNWEPQQKFNSKKVNIKVNSSTAGYTINSNGVTWTSGITYSPGNYVLNSGDSSYYACISSSSFHSATPPNQDPVNWKFLSTTQIDEMSETFKEHMTSNNSVNFDINNLAGWSFKPDIYGNDSLAVIGSTTDGTQQGYDGIITINEQMDEDGPFAGDVNGWGLLENNVDFNFPLKSVKRIRITVVNGSKETIRINGFKVYTPLLDSEGNAFWPSANIAWTINLNATVAGS
jgi:hypothetical protein